MGASIQQTHWTLDKNRQNLTMTNESIFSWLIDDEPEYSYNGSSPNRGQSITWTNDKSVNQWGIIDYMNKFF